MFEIVITIVGGIFAVVGGAGFWQYRISRKEAPIKVQQADLAVASTTQAMALQITAELRTDLDRLRTDYTRLEGRQEGFETQLREQGETITRLRSLVQAFSYGWDELVANWHTIRQREVPPAKPVGNLHVPPIQDPSNP